MSCELWKSHLRLAHVRDARDDRIALRLGVWLLYGVFRVIVRDHRAVQEEVAALVRRVEVASLVEAASVGRGRVDVGREADDLAQRELVTRLRDAEGGQVRAMRWRPRLWKAVGGCGRL